MTNEEKCNGWSNRETWALMLHLDNNEGSQQWLIETARLAGENAEASKIWTIEEAKLFTTEDAIKDAVETAFECALNPQRVGGQSAFVEDDCGESVGMFDARDVLRMIADVGSLWRVNWREIAKAALDRAADQ